eukprot:CAMPEP_0196571678 /NCGR_PEP_ID=MMETSP1081-20130531/1824_1 /TAXON_ID=36882 /ORGANISM="Pyramimonas amylifera, Strain CCMP720" /LENGTH=299 /DNA_ID=CAMNT_0041888711 /DNA_START=193 /DNA_END=1088 /DNA_ORIENTATION=+
MAKTGKDIQVVGGFQIEGLSVGGQETCIILPQYKVAFDIGRCPQRAVYMDTVLFSHTHLDHVSGIGAYVGMRSMLALCPPTLVLPSVNAAGLEALLSAYRELDTSPLPCEVVAAEVGDELKLDKNRRDLFVKVFRTCHTVPSQGYLICSRKQKLKLEFQGRPGQEIKQLRESGVEICDVEEVAEVAFTGDTTADWMLDTGNRQALSAKLLIMEVTFLDDSRNSEDARKFGHTHISEVAENAHLFQNEAILFIHFSARFSVEEIEASLDKHLPPDLRKKVTPLLVGFSKSSSFSKAPVLT